MFTVVCNDWSGKTHYLYSYDGSLQKVSKDFFIRSLSRGNEFLFKTYDKALKYKEKNRNFLCSALGVESIYIQEVSDFLLPKCDRKCFNCNKKHINHCKNLDNSYQNICGLILAKFPDEFVPDSKRLDAPCEKCLTTECQYNMR